MRIIFRIDDGTQSRYRKEPQSRFFRIAALAVIGIFLLVLVGSVLGDGGLIRIYQLTKDRENLQSRIGVEEVRQQELLGRIAALKDDPGELERIAREELGMVREGEIVFDFRPPGPQ